MSELRDELLELVRDVRTWVEWQASTGAQALVVDRDLRAALAARREASRDVERPVGDAQPQVARPAVAEPPADVRGGSRPAHAEGAPTTFSFQRPPVSSRAITEPTSPATALSVTEARGLFPSESLPRGERERRLEVLADTVAGCRRCSLAERRTQTVFARGNPMAELCFVGEGPGQSEDEQGLPFVGAAGKLLDKMIEGMGYARDDVYVCNIVKCRPENNRTPTDAEMAACTPYVAEQLELVQPRVIVALGATALRGLLGPGEGITKARGKWKLYRGAIPVMPTFHPSYVLRMDSREVKQQVWSDLKQVLAHVGRQPPRRA